MGQFWRVWTVWRHPEWDSRNQIDKGHVFDCSTREPWATPATDALNLLCLITSLWPSKRCNEVLDMTDI